MITTRSHRKHLPPHHGYQSPHRGYQSPHHGYQSPHHGYQTPHRGYQSPHHGYRSPHHDHESIPPVTNRSSDVQSHDDHMMHQYFNNNDLYLSPPPPPPPGSQLIDFIEPVSFEEAFGFNFKKKKNSKMKKERKEKNNTKVTLKKGKVSTPFTKEKVAPKKGKVSTPFMKEKVAPKKGKVSTPFTKEKVAPKKGKVSTPFMKEKVAPKKGKVSTPFTKEKVSTPFTKEKVTPKKEKVSIPFMKEKVTPKKEKVISPKKEKITPAMKRKLTLHLKVKVSPLVSENVTAVKRVKVTPHSKQKVIPKKEKVIAKEDVTSNMKKEVTSPIKRRIFQDKKIKREELENTLGIKRSSSGRRIKPVSNQFSLLSPYRFDLYGNFTGIQLSSTSFIDLSVDNNCDSDNDVSNNSTVSTSTPNVKYVRKSQSSIEHDKLLSITPAPSIEDVSKIKDKNKEFTKYHSSKLSNSDPLQCISSSSSGMKESSAILNNSRTSLYSSREDIPLDILCCSDGELDKMCTFDDGIVDDVMHIDEEEIEDEPSLPYIDYVTTLTDMKGKRNSSRDDSDISANLMVGPDF